MRKSMVLLLTLVFMISTVAFAAAPPKDVKISAAATKQPAVPFPHEAHTKIVKSCDTCHHTAKGMTAATADKAQKCATCHLDPKDPKAGNMKDASMTTNPMHKLCVGCHKTEKKGPVMCNKCHVKA